MPRLNQTQLDIIETWYLANATNLNDQQAADALNAPADPEFWVWRSSVSRAEIYNDTSPSSTTWDWTTYKNQGVAEQNAWVQMFMGDSANFSKLNLRAGIGKIFTGSAQANAQRNHCLAIGRRVCTLGEKLLAVAVDNPPANTGNNSSDALGASTNPALMTFEGNLLTSDVVDALR